MPTGTLRFIPSNIGSQRTVGADPFSRGDTPITQGDISVIYGASGWRFLLGT